jgi:transposase
MISERTIFEVHRLHHEGYSIRKIARTLSLSRDSVAKYLASPERKSPSIPRPSKLDSFKDEIARLLAIDPEASAEVIRQRLVPLGFDGRSTIVKDYLRTVRPAKKRKRAFIRYESPPGEQTPGTQCP